jgi:hypothetical protein
MGPSVGLWGGVYPCCAVERTLSLRFRCVLFWASNPPSSPRRLSGERPQLGDGVPKLALGGPPGGGPRGRPVIGPRICSRNHTKRPWGGPVGAPVGAPAGSHCGRGGLWGGPGARPGGVPPGGPPGGRPPYAQYCPSGPAPRRAPFGAAGPAGGTPHLRPVEQSSIGGAGGPPQKRTGCAPCRGAQKGPNFRPLWVFVPLFCGRSHHVSPC